MDNSADSEVILDLDFMISLKLYIEDEYNISDDNHDDIIFNIITYLRELNKSNDDIKTALYLLYDTIDPTKKEDIDSMIKPRLLMTSYSNIVQHLLTDQIGTNHTDLFTGDIINPANILNIFTQNINNIPNNSFHITFDTNRVNFPLLLNTNLNLLSPMFNFTIEPHAPTTVNENVLNQNTKIIQYKDLEDTLKSKYNTCFICLADFESEDTIRKIVCEHIFHKDCIDPWLLKESYKCPVCRSDNSGKKDT